jgi:precorrin-3B synthase
MQTGDGLLVRLVLHEPISLSKLSALCLAAEEHGNGIVEITQRGSLQIRGLNETSAPKFAHVVTSLQVGADEGPPLVTSPLLGLDAGEPFDSTDLVRSLLSAFNSARASLNSLSAKVSVLVDGGGRLHLDAVSADIRLVADGGHYPKVKEAVGAFQLSLAGSASDAMHLGYVSLERAPAVVLALLQALAARGPTARAKDLLNETSLQAVRQSLDGQLLEQDAGVAAQRSGAHAPPLTHPSGAHAPPLTKPLGAHAPLLTNPSGAHAPLLTHPSGAHARPLANPLGPHLLKNGDRALGVALPFGHTTAATLRRFVQAAADCGATSMRPAPDRALLAIGLSQAEADKLRDLAEQEDFIVDESDARRHVVACAGAPACASALLSTRQLAPEVARATRAWAGTLKVVHLAGCSKGCAHPGPATLTVVGPDRIVLNGRASDTSNYAGTLPTPNAVPPTADADMTSRDPARLLANIERLCREL